MHSELISMIRKRQRDSGGYVIYDGEKDDLMATILENVLRERAHHKSPTFFANFNRVNLCNDRVWSPNARQVKTRGADTLLTLGTEEIYTLGDREEINTLESKQDFMKYEIKKLIQNLDKNQELESDLAHASGSLPSTCITPR